MLYLPQIREWLAVEIEGFGHHHLKDFRKDMEKYNELTFRRIFLLRFTVKQATDGTAIKEIQRFLKNYNTEKLSNLF